MSRKTVSDMFYTAELESEIRIGKFLSGVNVCRFKKNEDRETYIKEVVMRLSNTRYTHSPSDGCAERGISFPCNNYNYYANLMQDVATVTPWMETGNYAFLIASFQ